MKFIPKASPIPTSYKSITLLSRHLIYSTSNINGNLPVFMKISDGQPCADSGEFNYYMGLAYKLDVNYGYTACTTKLDNSFYDISYIKLDTIHYLGLLKDNGVDSKTSAISSTKA